MIEAVMYVAIGALLAGLLGIALLPALWRRAVRLSRQRLIATMPTTPNEIAAEKDSIRAASAVEIRRLELRLEASEAHLQQARKDIGTHVATIQSRDGTITTLNASIAALRGDLAGRDAHIAELTAEIDRLMRERDNLATNLTATRMSNQALDMEGSALRQVSEQRQAVLASQEKQLASQTAKVAELQTVTANLTADLRKKADELRAASSALREVTARASILERRGSAAETLANERSVQIERLQAERLQLIDDAGQLQRARDSEKIEREARDAEVLRLAQQVADLQAAAERSRIAHSETLRDLTRTIEALRQEKHQYDTELAHVRLENTRLATQLSAQPERAPRRRRATSAE